MELRIDKTKSAITLFLMLTMAVTLVAVPLANAHDPPIELETYAYLAVSPNPVGVGQAVDIVMWIDKIPVSANGIAGDRWTNYRIKITHEETGDVDNLGPFTSDPTSSVFTSWAPDQVGTYTFEFTFPGQVASLYNPENGLPGSPSVYVNDTFLPSSATTTLIVQEDPIEKISEYPLPNSYWTRPIEGRNTAWASIASNWLGGRGGSNPTYNYNIQPDGAAPNSPHIMWTRHLQDGGVVGGSYEIEGNMYYVGDSYEMRFNNPLIIQGRLYYDLPLSSAKYGGGYICVDLRTGEEIWFNDEIRPSFGQLFDYESLNQHGVINGYLWQTQGSTWNAYDAVTGSWLFTLTDVPSGINEYGPKGEIVRYVLDSDNKWLALWNNTQDNTGLHGAIGTSTNAYQWRPVGKTVNMSTAYSWNVTVSDSIPSGSSVYYVIPDDLLFGVTATTTGGFSAYGTIDYSAFAISLKPETRGNLLWIKDYAPPAGLITRQFGPVDPVNRVFTMLDKETMQWLGYDLDSGDKLWGPVGDPRDYQYYSSRGGGGGSQQSSAYGILYDGGYGGLIFAYDTLTGDLLWTYGNGGSGNSTNSGVETFWGNYPTFIGAIADGKIYTFTAEHSVNTPIYKGALIRCLNATTGEEIWTLTSFATSTSFYSRIGAIADGYLAYLNAYDGQVYCVGKGPSATAVSIQNDVVSEGSSVLITGTVTDESAGAKSKVESGEFTMVPAVSDESMGSFMEYIYMQKPMPQDAVGVDVLLQTLDPNGNFYDIGTATTDSSGMYSLMWEPPVPGKYTVIATFQGSESYYASYAETAFGVTEASPTPPPEEPLTLPPTDMYVLATGIAIIIAIAILGVIILKKH